MKPEFVDNRNGNTMKEALAGHLEHRIASGKIPAEVCIASAYFNPAGFAQVAAHLEKVPKVRLLLGAEPSPEAGLVRRRPMDPTEPAFSKKQLAQGLKQLELGLRIERDRMAFSVQNSRSLQSLVAFLRSGRIEVRRFEREFLHAKAYIFAGEEAGFIAGSSNFTFAGLVRNLELNLGRYEDPVVARAQQWFEDLWKDGAPYDLADLYEEMFRQWRPYDVYLRILWELYGAEIEEAAKSEGIIPLTSFQKHGVWRAQKILERYGGVMVADEVGLGKTFIAGDLTRLYCERRQRVLLVCPAALRDSTWKKFIHDYHLYIECVSYEELASDRQFMDVRPSADQGKLKSKLDEYALVVVDEAHNYRNPDTPARAAVLRRLLFGPRKDLVLLTATPVNNSLWDLFTLIHYFVRQDSALADRGVLSIRARFEDAMRADPTSLNPDLLYPVIDATTVKRTRAFIKKHYAGERIRAPDGQLVPIVFPDPKPITMRYDLDRALPGFFDRIVDALDPEDGGNQIEFARYRIEEYRVAGQDPEEVNRGHAVVGLLRSGLLKRFESSAHAFAKTVSRMVEHHKLFLDALKSGKVVTTEFLREISGDDETAFDEQLEEHSELVLPAADFDVKTLRKNVERDLLILQELASEANAVRASQDPKLVVLIEELKTIAQQASDEGIDEIDRTQKRKVLIFSFYADTVDWIREHLGRLVLKEPGLAPYRKRLAFVKGSTGGDDVSRENAVYGFAPLSSGAPPGKEADLYDLMVTTDVLAEGVNLQQCRHIINYDLPWNPMRLVQRHGRIDRIGSTHRRVFLRTIFPHDRLDAMLDLESRILDKLAQAAASIGVGTPPIAGARGSGHVFAETRDEIEKLLHEDPTLFENGGTAAAAQTGEEYRQELRKALERDRERIVNLPWKAGAGMRKGKERGVLFCARVDERVYLRFIGSTPEWHPLENAVISELGTCLRMIECSQETPAYLPGPLQVSVFDFWDVARGNIYRAWERETDPASTQPKVRPLNRKVAQFVRDNVPHDTDDGEVRRALEILESPWPRREEVMLRELFEADDLAAIAKSQKIIEFTLKTGLEPFIAPPPLPPIEEDDIHLVGWIALETEREERSQRT